MTGRNNFYLAALLVLMSSCRSTLPDNNTQINPEKFELRTAGLLCAEALGDFEWYESDQKAKLFEGVDVIDFAISTDVTEAQQYFNQGMTWALAFNHAEAARSFFECSRIDPECAMCHWGFAYALGPNYNAGMEPDNYERAITAIEKAQELNAGATKLEKMLIHAMSVRYALPVPEDRTHLDRAYSKALKQTLEAFPDNDHVATLYAESLMDLHPWDLYEHDGTIKSWTPEILQALDQALLLNPDHPGAHHLYIHAVEASKTPELGYQSAQKFDNGLVPGSGHLIHMPSHIYIQTGDYAKGLDANVRAVSVDSSYIAQAHAQGAYPLAYYPHNMHFLAACAMYAGNQQWAAIGANKVSQHAHRKLYKDPNWMTLQHYYTMPYHIAVKFGQWDDILKMENYEEDMIYAEGIRHFARGMAYLGKDDLENARRERDALKAYSENPELAELFIWGINDMATLIVIAEKVLSGELLHAQNSTAESIDLLHEAIALEDELMYQEPSDWLLHVRHHLGAIFLESGSYKNAIAIYQEDLLDHPKNGWALKGLQKAYEQLGLKDQAAEIGARFQLAWTRADIKINGSRIL